MDRQICEFSAPSSWISRQIRNPIAWFLFLLIALGAYRMTLIDRGHFYWGDAGSAAAFGSGMVVTCAYEFCHCIQHLAYAPKSRFLARIKKLHLLHHFHNEQGNYGITNFMWDRLLGSFYGAASARPRSATTFNLGYDEAEGERYPWVRELTSGDASGGD